MSRRETGWERLRLWPRHPCPAPGGAPGTHHPSEPDGSCAPEGADLPIGLTWPAVACVSSPIWGHGTQTGADGRARGLLPHTRPPGHPGGGTLVQRDRSSTLGELSPPLGWHLEQGLQGVEVAGLCVHLGGVLASWGRGGNVPPRVPMRVRVLPPAQSLGLPPEASAQASPCPEMWGHRPTRSHQAVHTGPSSAWPLALALPAPAQNPRGPFPWVPRGRCRRVPLRVRHHVLELPAAPGAQPYRWLLHRAGSQPPPSRAAAFCVPSRCASASPRPSRPSAARAPRCSPHRSQPHTQVNFSAFSSN